MVDWHSFSPWSTPSRLFQTARPVGRTMGSQDKALGIKGLFVSKANGDPHESCDPGEKCGPYNILRKRCNVREVRYTTL
jgi:hypothetical protein